MPFQRLMRLKSRRIALKSSSKANSKELNDLPLPTNGSQPVKATTESVQAGNLFSKPNSTSDSEELSDSQLLRDASHLSQSTIKPAIELASWVERCLLAEKEKRWVGVFFDDREISFDGPSRLQTWKIQSKFGEEKFEAETERRDPYHQNTATGVYECTQIAGETPGIQAVIKIHMQIPNLDPLSYDPPDETTEWIDREVDALRVIQGAQGEVPAPRLIATKTELQNSDMWIPGGFVCFIVMQKLPGVTLSKETFWGRSRAQRDEVRAAFRAALEKVWSLQVGPQDCGLRNLLWDEKAKKCYLVDMENAFIFTGKPRWHDRYYVKWGLKTDLRDRNPQNLPEW